MPCGLMARRLACFNSKLVRLEEAMIALENRRQNSFNSKLVRLEVKMKSIIDSNYLWFQFQTGSIRSALIPFEILSYLMFRFQTGSIRRIRGGRGVCSPERFDSKLVRLEGSPKTTLILYWTLTVPVKLIFIFSRFEHNLLSTSNRAKSLGG